MVLILPRRDFLKYYNLSDNSFAGINHESLLKNKKFAMLTDQEHPRDSFNRFRLLTNKGVTQLVQLKGGTLVECYGTICTEFCGFRIVNTFFQIGFSN